MVIHVAYGKRLAETPAEQKGELGTVQSCDGCGAVPRARTMMSMTKSTGILIFDSIQEALRAGYAIESPIPDSEGHLHARIRTPDGWAKALVKLNREA